MNFRSCELFIDVYEVIQKSIKLYGILKVASMVGRSVMYVHLSSL